MSHLLCNVLKFFGRGKCPLVARLAWFVDLKKAYDRVT